VPPSVLAGRVVLAGQPLWLQEDTDLAVALTEIEAERCECGHSRTESMDPAHEFDWQAEAVRCHACAARERAARSAARDDAWDESGIRWVTTRRGSDGH
jgi:hypothetical protein